MQKNVRFWSYLVQFSAAWEMFETRFVDKMKTQTMFKIFFPRKTRRLWENVKKYDSRTDHRWQCINLLAPEFYI
jgi:hypothetical protein